MSVTQLTRSLQPPVFVPLRSLRISEPHDLSVVRRDVLLSFALLPQLHHLTFFVWNERAFGPSLVKEIHEALPDLEELGIGLESEQLSWWQGSLVRGRHFFSLGVVADDVHCPTARLEHGTRLVP